MKLSLALAAGAALALASCTTEPDALTGSQDLTATLNIIVLDAATAAPVEDVRLEIIGEGSKRTAANGEATFTGLRAGGYIVRLSAEDYETSQETVTMGTAGTQDVAALWVSQTFRVHKQGARVKGRVLMRPFGTDTTAIVGAAGVRVELRSTATGTGSGTTTYLTPLRVATTNSTGHYTFDSLPEISNYAVTIPEFTAGGKIYSQASTAVASGNLLSGQEYTQPNLLLVPAPTGTFQVFARSLSLVPAQPWVLEFSHPVDTAKLSASSIQLRTTVNINSTRSWNAGLTVLSIQPATGTWVVGTTYSVVLTGVRDSQNRVLATTTITSLQVP